MIPQHVHTAIEEAFNLLPEKMGSLQARVMLLVIGLQESGFRVSRQYGGGPARGYWQFEKIGVLDVLTRNTSRRHALSVCEKRGVEPSVDNVHAAIEFDNVLAAVFARLALLNDPRALPAIGDAPEAWDLYVRTWRPGKPHPERWRANYTEACRSV